MQATNRRNWLLPLIFALSSGAIAQGSYAEDPQVLYVPYVSAVTDEGPTTFNRWESTLGFFNNTDVVATYVQVAMYGTISGVSPPSCGGPIPPHTGIGVGFGPCAGGIWKHDFGFAAFRTSPGVIAWSDVTRVRYTCPCGSYPECVASPQGGTPTPVYRALFPAGRTAVTGAVELGLLDVSDGDPCGRAYKRRVNVTLFNGGDATGTFVVSVIPANNSSAPLSRQTVTVPAKSVIQINSLPVPTVASKDLGYVNSGFRVWIAITADQLFLSYVSAVFDNPEPGALPFEVYPSYLQN